MKVHELISKLKKMNQNEHVCFSHKETTTERTVYRDVNGISRNNYILGYVDDFGDEDRLTRVVISGSKKIL